MRRLIALAVALAGAAAGCACGDTPGKSEAAGAVVGSQQARVPGEYLVTLAARADVKAISDLYGQFEITGLRDLGQNVFLVTLSDDPGPARMEKLRGGNVYIKAVQPNFVYGTRGPGNAR
jgi:hypothetical protein